MLYDLISIALIDENIFLFLKQTNLRTGTKSTCLSCMVSPVLILKGPPKSISHHNKINESIFLCVFSTKKTIKCMTSKQYMLDHYDPVVSPKHLPPVRGKSLYSNNFNSLISIH